MKYHKILGRGLLVMFAALSLWGCGNGNGDAPSFNGVTGEHPANWLATHSAAYIANPSSCSECHGKDLLGGISKVSCAKCHPLPTSPHPAGWANPAQHGAAAKAKPGSMTGFSSCQGCHGADFGGGFTGVSCFGCHKPGPPLVKVPHAESPWFDITQTDVTHTNTDPQNAPVCANCHRRAPGTPGCFNNTLCHGNITHDFPYYGSVHGPVADPLGPSFSICLVCHNNSPDKIGVYPVPPGTPPNCRGCHTKASPENGCGACHGTDAGGGRPNGSSFPDVTGSHFVADPSGHQTFDCTWCHGINSGDGFPTHGPSNRTAHNDDYVVIQFTGDATGTVYTRSGLKDGHGSCSNVPCHENRNW